MAAYSQHQLSLTLSESTSGSELERWLGVIPHVGSLLRLLMRTPPMGTLEVEVWGDLPPVESVAALCRGIPESCVWHRNSMTRCTAVELAQWAQTEADRRRRRRRGASRPVPTPFEEHPWTEVDNKVGDRVGSEAATFVQWSLTLTL